VAHSLDFILDLLCVNAITSRLYIALVLSLFVALFVTGVGFDSRSELGLFCWGVFATYWAMYLNKQPIDDQSTSTSYQRYNGFFPKFIFYGGVIVALVTLFAQKLRFAAIDLDVDKRGGLVGEFGAGLLLFFLAIHMMVIILIRHEFSTPRVTNEQDKVLLVVKNMEANSLNEVIRQIKKHKAEADRLCKTLPLITLHVFCIGSIIIFTFALMNLLGWQAGTKFNLLGIIRLSNGIGVAAGFGAFMILLIFGPNISVNGRWDKISTGFELNFPDDVNSQDRMYIMLTMKMYPVLSSFYGVAPQYSWLYTLFLSGVSTLIGKINSMMADLEAD